MVQGEGPYAGRACAFIRLGWCNLHCPPCDTKPTWDTTQYDLTETCPDTEITAIVAGLPDTVRLVVISGGEGLLWQRVPAFHHMTDALAARGIEMHMETNGTIPPSEATNARIRHYSVSPKLSAMGGADPAHRRIKPAVLTAFTELAHQGRAVFKFVVADDGHLDEVATFARTHHLDPSWVWVMPEAGDLDTLLARQPAITAGGAQRGFNVSTRLHLIAQCR
ncbi:7-carboxy-7-deazaguanine synthase QueE [Streptomyces sp. NPDC050085]|uniref:7-carboxy-7-deazaguanine synthase QueE n=1 Tax=Streptomyces sp. NPDC050085 TaxID=3365600 RepID=UPI0037979A0F